MRVKRENPPTSGIVLHDFHRRTSGVTRPGVEPVSPWWEARSLTSQPPRPHFIDGVFQSNSLINLRTTLEAFGWGESGRPVREEATLQGTNESRSDAVPTAGNTDIALQHCDGNTSRLARRSDEALGVHFDVAHIAPSFLDLGCGVPTEVHPTLKTRWRRNPTRLCLCYIIMYWHISILTSHQPSCITSVSPGCRRGHIDGAALGKSESAEAGAKWERRPCSSGEVLYLVINARGQHRRPAEAVHTTQTPEA
ncbi:hypothetical protein PR048_025079 [Dryococelus australis]|uniref:Uncharacterized protein n=1 Tax=Dryococelus australis TaxID=614101 RepID=A0ABQ9GQG2_9NEOP|nr:hypothetical protein PR048_025079 [Dryococelus australis]